MASHHHHNRHGRFSWSDLQPELLEAIADCLNSNSDHLQAFRAVCKNWRSSIPPPFLCLNPSLPHKTPYTYRSLPFNDSGRPFSIVSTAVYLLSPRRRRSSSTATATSAGGCWMVGVEQLSAGKIRLLHPLTGLPVKDLPENFVNFSTLNVSKGFNLRFFDGSRVIQDNPTSFSVSKVVLWPNPNLDGPGIRDSSLMVLHNKGDLVCLRLSDFSRQSVVYACVYKFDDIVHWKGFIFAVDRSGRLYGIEYYSGKVVTVVVAIPIMKGSYDKRKRLVVSDNELYLIVRDSTSKRLKIDVYVLNEQQYEWEVITSFYDWVLFVGFDTCFFVDVHDLHWFGGNCIVYPKGCFPSYSSNYNPDDDMFRGASGYLQLGVYIYGNVGILDMISSFPGLSNVFWPSPSWLCEDAALSNQEYDDEDLQMDFPGQHSLDVSCGKVTSAIEGDKPSSNPSIELRAEEYPSTIDHQSHVHAKDTREAVTEDSLLAIASISHFNTNDATEEFHGIVVRSDLIPILQKIWAKHGDIMKDSVVRHKGILAGALEALAKMTLILLNTSGRSLNDSQAHDLGCVLHDLRNLHFKVDWLAPIVKKALKRHKSKPMFEFVVKLEKAKSRAEEMRTKLHGLLKEAQHTLEGLEEKRRLVTGTVDGIGLDEWLGEGIF